MDKKKRKLRLCRYHSSGFGSKSGWYYLLDQYGHIYDIETEYDKFLDERYFVVNLPDGTFAGNTIKELISEIELADSIKVLKW